MAYQLDLKGRGRLCCSDLLIWILPLFLQLPVKPKRSGKEKIKKKRLKQNVNKEFRTH